MATAAAADRPDNVFVNLLRDRRIVLSVLLTAAIATYFWTQSRYPALNEKAAMGGDTNMSGIAFDEILEWVPNSSFAWELTVNTVNWIYTNWKGMTFGVLFAACALTLLGLIERRGFNNRFANAALGAAIGTPLGVCVNCAAPIARGLHSAGMRLETTLSALIASPTLNVIVVSMSFALLPLHLATLKLVGALAFVLIGVPILTRIFHPKGLEDDAIAKMQGQVDDRRGWIARKLEALRPLPVPASDVDSWPKAFVWLARTFGRNLVFIIAVTVPLMLLAGALGAILITFFDFQEFRRVIGVPTSVPMILVAMTLIAVVAIFLPVPIAFDVILAVILINAGWPVRYVMPLLFALGCYSVYSFMIVGRAISWRISAAMMGSLAALAVVLGVAANWIDKSIIEERHDANIAFLSSMPTTQMERAPGQPSLAPLDEAGIPEITYRPVAATVANEGPGTVSVVEAAPVNTPSAGADIGFSRLLGSEVGLDLRPQSAGYEVLEPYTFFWGLASGDTDGDGWVDILMSRTPATGGLAYFRNIGGRFQEVPIMLGPLAEQFIGTIMLSDLNGDRRPDLFVSSYMRGTHILWNRDGRFDWNDRTDLPNGDAGLVGAPGFADLDGDGDIDILAANWTIGTTANNGNPYLLSSQDRIFWNEGGSFTPQMLDGVPGESLASLITDIDGDGRPDLIIGDDVSTADKIYLNQGERKFRLARKSDGIVPYLTRTSMSLDMGDIDNDLIDEFYVAQIAWSRWRVESVEPEMSYCGMAEMQAGDSRECFLSLRNRSLSANLAHSLYSRCDEIQDSLYRWVCAARSLSFRASFLGETSECYRLVPYGAEWKEMCEVAARPRFPNAEKVMEEQDYVGGINARNIFFKRTAGSGFLDETTRFDVAKPGWSWNSRFVDLDQDGWQDIFVATGMAYHRNTTPNTYYRNRGGAGFVQAQDRFGLSDTVPSTTYALIDYDRDGDVDVIRTSAVTQPIIHRNDAPAGGALWVRLQDDIGNRDAIGARIVVTTDDGISRARDIRQSGGFATGIDPVAHFGLGKASRVAKIEVTWRDGAKTSIDGEFAPNSEIIVRRSR
ncbi:FG-GAP-like repeat-containing protein [Erythrobacter sp. HKB08]|uniref:FG-GAP-like repeat-containing protein n=1 Tax=Erythrobacter sp. HKB08 TaxID=2502843 RepID=UPI0010092E93|nr:FG-GAP-like repeat-containing protein [Erythrobacter sp. HKB08]